MELKKKKRKEEKGESETIQYFDYIRTQLVKELDSGCSVDILSEPSGNIQKETMRYDARYLVWENCKRNNQYRDETKCWYKTTH